MMGRRRGTNIMARTIRSTQSRHFNGIDGLRALAIIGVIAYHTRPSMLPGGLLGVTLFFVVSGFFITRSVYSEIDRQKFRYVAYLRKRLTRIWPPVLATIGFAALLMYCWLPSLLLKIKSDALSSALFASNWVYIFRHDSYFAAAGLPSPLTHLWYTSLIMQFYVLWPVVLVALMIALHSRKRLIAGVGVLIALSTIEMAVLFGNGANVSRVYYGLDTRAAELLVGALLALLTVNVQRTARIAMRPVWNRVLPWLGCAAIVIYMVAFVTVDGQSAGLYRGGLLVFALLGALVVYCCTTPSWFSHALSIKPLRYLGSRSFSLYLVHYPLLEVMHPATRTTPIHWWEWILQFLLILIVGEIFYQFVEAFRGTPVLPWSHISLREWWRAVVVPKLRTTAGVARDHAPAWASRLRMPNMPSMPDMWTWHGRRTATFNGTSRAHRLRTSAIVLGAIGAVIVAALTFAPLNWNQIVQARAIQLRPELAAPAVSKPKPKSQPKDGQSQAAQQAGPHPQAEKVPQNLAQVPRNCNAQDATCDAHVLIVGDSVTVGAAPAIQQHFPNAIVDGQVSRSFLAGVDIVRNSIAADHPQIVIVALGANDLIEENEVKAMMDSAQNLPIYFVTPRAPVAWVDPGIATLRAMAPKYPNMGIIDWNGLSGQHPEYLVDDGTHLSPIGQVAYGNMIYAAICGAQ